MGRHIILCQNTAVVDEIHAILEGEFFSGHQLIGDNTERICVSCRGHIAIHHFHREVWSGSESIRSDCHVQVNVHLIV